MFNEIGINARKASKIIGKLGTDEKNTVLYDMSQELINNKDIILTSNKLDLENSKELKKEIRVHNKPKKEKASLRK